MLELKDDNGNLLSERVQKRVNDFIEHLKEATCFRPSKNLKKSEVDKQAKFVLKCFGVEAEVEYRELETDKDSVLAYKSIKDSAWDSAFNSAYNLAYELAFDSAYELAFDSTYNSAFDSAFNSAFELDWASVWDSARTATELLIIDNKDFKEKYPNGAFTQLFKLWEMGLYPVGVLEENKKFVIYVDPKYCLKENWGYDIDIVDMPMF